MKKLLVALLLVPVVLAAQKVKVDNDTIFKDGKPYGLLHSTGALEPTYSIRTLTNSEIAVCKNDPDIKDANGRMYYRVTFMQSGNVAHFPNSIGMAKKLAQAFVESDIIHDSVTNPEGEKRFLALYPNRATNQTSIVVINTTNAPDYSTAQRNKFGPVTAGNGTLMQGGVNIGTYATSTNFSGGKSIQTTTYTLPSGVQCAVATYDNIGAKTASVRTLKDNITHTVTIKNAAMCEQNIADWLSENGYL